MSVEIRVWVFSKGLGLPGQGENREKGWRREHVRLVAHWKDQAQTKHKAVKDTALSLEVQTVSTIVNEGFLCSASCLRHLNGSNLLI